MSLSELEKLKQIDWSSIDWQAELKNNINSIDTLKQYVELSESEEKTFREVVANHPMNIPRYYLSLIKITTLTRYENWRCPVKKN